MDWIGVVEAAYRLHGSPDDWIGGVVEQAEAELDAGFGAYGYVFGLNEAKVSVRALAARGILAGNEPQIRVATEMAPIDAIGVMFASGIVAGSAQAVLAPVGLAEQFEQIVLMGTGGTELLGSGRTTKEIAYELGVSPSAVTNASARVRKKLGLESTPELVSFFAPGGIRARLARFALSGPRSRSDWPRT